MKIWEIFSQNQKDDDMQITVARIFVLVMLCLMMSGCIEGFFGV